MKFEINKDYDSRKFSEEKMINLFSDRGYKSITTWTLGGQTPTLRFQRISGLSGHIINVFITNEKKQVHIKYAFYCKGLRFFDFGDIEGKARKVILDIDSKLK